MGLCLSSCIVGNEKKKVGGCSNSVGLSPRRNYSGSSDGSDDYGNHVSGAIDDGIRHKGFCFGEDELHRIPGRVFLNGATYFSCLHTQQGKKGTNQDAMLVWENFGSRSDTIFCGVFDGHGPFGHLVAKKVRDSLPIKLCYQWKPNICDHSGLNNSNSVFGSLNSEETASISMDEEWGESLDADENEKLPDIYLTLKRCLLKAFKLMDEELKLQRTIDCFSSGTTAVTLVKQGQHLIIGNVGDSRAVLGTRDKDHVLVAIQLTVDLKPNLPREAARIQQCRGRVFALQDEPEVARVWLPDNDSPGLAMARAFGDFCLKDFGLISVPVTSYRHLTERDEFVVLATDGVWDVLSNKEVVDIVASAPTRATAARALVDCAVRAWRLKFPTSKPDDCAVVCLFLDTPCSSKQAYESDTDKTPNEEMETTVYSLTNNKIMVNREAGRPISDMAWVQASAFEHSYLIDGVDEIVPVSEPKQDKNVPNRCQSTRSLAECISATDEEEWSALEGVTRVNSLVSLPRFAPGDKKSASWRKWL